MQFNEAIIFEACRTWLLNVWAECKVRKCKQDQQQDWLTQGLSACFVRESVASPAPETPPSWTEITITQCTLIITQGSPKSLIVYSILFPMESQQYFRSDKSIVCLHE